MEAKDNMKLAVRKAISAHEEAANTIGDLSSSSSDTTYSAMLARVKQNLSELHALAQDADPADTV